MVNIEVDSSSDFRDITKAFPERGGGGKCIWEMLMNTRASTKSATTAMLLGTTVGVCLTTA